LTTADAIGAVIWYSTLRVLPAEGDDIQAQRRFLSTAASTGQAL